MILMLLLIAWLWAPAHAQTDVVNGLKAEYKAAGAVDFSANRGKERWTSPSSTSKSGKPISCSTCHGADLRAAGRHAETSEPIEPISPSANPKRLTDKKTVEKWFKRNCKEVYSRECTPQEKGDFLAFISEN